MEINFENKTIVSTDFSDFETAWRIDDAISVLKYLRSNEKIILGGDILTEKLVHSYDSWYYDNKPEQSRRSNVEESYKKAFEYISRYIKANGNQFYVVFVTN